MKNSKQAYSKIFNMNEYFWFRFLVNDDDSESVRQKIFLKNIRGMGN